MTGEPLAELKSSGKLQVTLWSEGIEPSTVSSLN